ncbi:YncE family protein [Chryseobacterium taihuense]|uniref:40-residue YVTN family beta-propeller repeat-containing protein n=1 Tax=Chryseobacterium taihuense TaxID=1141221 RepID=A0ABY0QSH8_9FLAO|nr:DUF5074 domain-containing protein [Chryseobacterium taihuense]SDL72496.1 hypothetical protein SAMN05216273_10593 [Chryseobacterium taihuense]
MKFNKLLQIIFGFVLFFSISCTSEYEETITEISYQNGYFITNEGNYGQPNAEVSFITKDLNLLQNDIYKANNNNENLGDVLQTMAVSGDKAFLLLNNSNKIQVVNRYTFKKLGTITSEINQPRYMAVANNMLYVSNDQYLGAKYVSVYKTSDLSFVKKIPFSDTAERVVSAGGNIFVQNATYGFGNTLTKINTTNNEIDGTPISVPNGNINKTIAYNNNVYVIAEGTANSYLYEISPAGTITKNITLTSIPNATNLQIDGGKFFFSSANKIYSMDLNATAAPTTPIITAVDGGQYYTLYGFNVMDGRIFTSDVKGFSQASEMNVYTTSGTLIKKFTVGMGANGVYSN